MSIYKVALDSVSAHIAILDKAGIITETNRAWSEFDSDNGMMTEPSQVGQNYLEMCDRCSREGLDEPAIIAAGIRQVISGQIEEFFINYPCDSASGERWFALRIVPLRGTGAGGAVMSQENITPLMRAHQALAQREKEVREHGEKLEERNIALKVLLDHRQKDRENLEQYLLTNVRSLVLPYVQELMAARLAKRERALLEIIEDRLNEVTSPFMHRLSSLHALLTPQELRVATLVKEGRSSSEIAEVLLISVSGVDFHRKKIRKKLGMTNTSRNLRSYLLSLG